LKASFPSSHDTNERLRGLWPPSELPCRRASFVLSCEFPTTTASFVFLLVWSLFLQLCETIPSNASPSRSGTFYRSGGVSSLPTPETIVSRVTRLTRLHPFIFFCFSVFPFFRSILPLYNARCRPTLLASWPLFPNSPPLAPD